MSHEERIVAWILDLESRIVKLERHQIAAAKFGREGIFASGGGDTLGADRFDGGVCDKCLVQLDHVPEDEKCPVPGCAGKVWGV